MLSQNIKDSIAKAEGKAIATNGTTELNVVPVSIVEVRDEDIRLFNFYMDKTVANVKENSAVAFSAWRGFSGVQVKGEAAYHEGGEVFEEGVAYVASVNPDWVVKGVIVLKPEKIFNVSTGENAGKEIVQ